MNSYKIQSIKLNNDRSIDATFYNGIVKRFFVNKLYDKYPNYKDLDTNDTLWESAEILPQGSGIYFNDDIDLTSEEIWEDGIVINQEKAKEMFRIAYYLSHEREIKQLTQNELAKKTGISQCDISRIEAAVANPTLNTLIKLCEALDLEIIIKRKSTEVEL